MSWLGVRRRVSRAGLAVGAFSLLVSVSAGALVGYQACAVYDPSLLLPGDAGVRESAAPEAACNHAYYPDRPPSQNPATFNVGAVLALRSIDLGLSPDGGLPPYGFDLDHVCTCPGPPSCVQEQNAPETCDDEAGRDHAALELFRELGTLAGTGTEQINQGLESGQYGLLLDIESYNNTPNDEQVIVSVYASNGVSGIEDGGSPNIAHDGTDRWTIDPSSLRAGIRLVGKTCDPHQGAVCIPNYVDDNAYVADGVLVAKIDGFPIAFGNNSFLGGAVMNLRGAVIVAKLDGVALSGGGMTYRITDGTIAGRWPTSQFLSTLAAIPDTIANETPFICGANNIAYAYMRFRACEIADITSDLSLDNTNAPCDALSMGFRFEAEPAHLGEVYPISPAQTGCTTDAGLPFTDSCFTNPGP